MKVLKAPALGSLALTLAATASQLKATPKAPAETPIRVNWRMLLLPITFLKNLFTCELANIVASDQLFLSWFFRFLFLWVNWWTLLLPITFLIKLWNILLMIIWKFLESFEIPFPTSPPPSLQQLPKRTKLFEFHHKKISVLPFQRTHSPLIQSLQVSFRNNHHLCSMAHRPAYHKAHSFNSFKSLNR